MTDRMRSLSPSITTMIRMDHTHVLMLFRRYHPDTSLARKRAIVTAACLALEVHAQLEEEIFYPALRKVLSSAHPVLDKSEPEHAEMKQLVARLRSTEPSGVQYDENFRDLMRVVLHHVADEETVLLPLAEQMLKAELSQLGAAMTRRRMQLLRPRARQIASSTARSFPVLTGALAFAAVGLGMVLLMPRGGRNRMRERIQQGAERARRYAPATRPMVGESRL